MAIKYAIKKGDRYYKEDKMTFVKNINNASLYKSKKDANEEIETFWVILSNCNPVPIRETYSREEVR